MSEAIYTSPPQKEISFQPAGKKEDSDRETGIKKLVLVLRDLHQLYTQTLLGHIQEGRLREASSVGLGGSQSSGVSAALP